MKITALIENTACNEDIFAAHGLGLFIETQNHKILFDAGPNGDKLIKNARTLGINLCEADIAILSHGHYDHSGGMQAFFENNTGAVLYMNIHAVEPHFSVSSRGERYIGISKELIDKYKKRIIYTDGFFEIDQNLILFSDLKTNRLISGSGAYLFEKDSDGLLRPDSFKHEQSLIIKENGRTVLISGCAHRGIVNIVERCSEITENDPDMVVSGFHLTNPGEGTDEPEELIRAVAKELVSKDTQYYSCHCTGINPFNYMKSILGDKLRYLAAGETIEFGGYYC